MKTIKELKALQETVKSTNKYLDAATKKQLIMIREAILYLETSPSKEVIKKQLDKAVKESEKAAENKPKQFNFMDDSSYRAALSEHNKEYEPTKLKEQILFLKFILG